MNLVLTLRDYIQQETDFHRMVAGLRALAGSGLVGKSNNKLIVFPQTNPQHFILSLGEGTFLQRVLTLLIRWHDMCNRGNAP